jgi:carbonic anhydrase
MQKLVAGIHHFQSDIFRPRREFFDRLAAGQSPEVLFITCSDSRVNPNLITQTEPGELFILRNAGNIVPPYGTSAGGEAATIEFAVAALGVKDIVICGHTHCGAMKGLLDRPDSTKLPAVEKWLMHAEATRRIVLDKYSDRAPAALLTTTIEENVLVQLDHLRTHPAVAAGLASERLKLHGWVYKIETGEVFAYDAASGQFTSILERSPLPVPMPARLTNPVAI